MNSFNPAEAYVSPHMMSFVGLESSSGSTSSGQRQQLWDWETATQQPPGNPAPLHQASLFPDAAAPTSNGSAIYGCAAATPVVPAMGGVVGGGGYVSYSFHSSGYPGGLIKSEEDVRGGGAGQNIGLNLGHRTYFPSGDAVAVDHLFRRTTRGIYQMSQQVPRCQAEGCKADLSGAKHYHRRHKVCELHSKAALVVAGGLQQRFCQQCSRFHPLSEFDEAKRSCRRRLAEHNRRRRKSSQTPPTASTAASDGRSTPPDLSAAAATSADKRRQGSPKSMRIGAASKEIITGTTGSSVSTGSTHSQANMSIEKAKDYQKTATHLRNGQALSLGVAGREAAAADKGGCFGFPYQQQQMPWAVMSDENNSSQPQQRIISSSSSSSGIFFQPQNYFCSSANEAATGQSTTGSHHHHHQIGKPPLQLGQGMLEVDFI
ncbi:hypothetical protein Taro_011058 [Colocasia esculenta]|uniref:SBP-type domain-containing protein n=1 Tax=Colocasia esculenta TaxID=4460 RepID=A0A843UEZ3_COLES|nr:hypothetical protein [Colocasia esculenta]